METSPTKRSRSIRVIYALAFLFALSVAIPTYINSTFISEFVSDNGVGAVYTIGSALGIIALALIPLLLRKKGNVPVTITMIVASVTLLLAIAFIRSVLFVIPLVLLYFMIIRLVGYDIDLLLENFSQDSTTGSTRGAFLTVTNIAWVFAPITAGFLLGSDNYWRVYAVAAGLLILLIPLIAYNFRGYQDPQYDRTPFWRTLKAIYRKKDIYKVFVAQLLLRFFYSWMVIYTPIYLHEHLGMAWSTIGIIFTIMLLPFILLEFPLGKIADTKLGEKEIMTLGFVVLAISTGALSFITSSALWVWALALFITRVGASMIEVMGETYFFKKIDDTDSELLGFFRMTAPLAYIFGPLIALIALAFVDFRFIFLILGTLMFWGLRYSLTLKDTL